MLCTRLDTCFGFRQGPAEEGREEERLATFSVLSSRFPHCQLLIALSAFVFWGYLTCDCFKVFRHCSGRSPCDTPYPSKLPFSFIQLPTRIAETVMDFRLKLQQPPQQHLRQRFCFLKVSQHISLTFRCLFINKITTHTRADSTYFRR